MKILMLVATSVATDTRVLREATTLVDAGHTVHIIGRSVPEGYAPPPGITVSSVGTSSVFRKEGGASLAGRRLKPHVALARWVLLPQHRASAFGRWASGAVDLGASLDYDVVHAHDFTALEAGADLARRARVPLIYDTHELWSGRPREYRPTPVQDRRERALERALGAEALAVITVGDGVANALRERYAWDHVTVVRNTFPTPDTPPDVPDRPRGLVYAGRLSAYRELETIAAASALIDLPVTVMGPADDTWLGSWDPGRVTVAPTEATDDVDAKLTAAGIALVTHSDRWENHRLALPNKLFHAVRAGVPVVATDVGELARVVHRYDLGEVYPPGDPAGLADAVRAVVADYPRYRRRVAEATQELSWPTDADALLAVYARVPGAREPSDRITDGPAPPRTTPVEQ